MHIIFESVLMLFTKNYPIFRYRIPELTGLYTKGGEYATNIFHQLLNLVYRTELRAYLLC